MYAFCTRVRCAEGRQRSRACGEDAPARALLQTLIGPARTQAPQRTASRVSSLRRRHASRAGAAAPRLRATAKTNTATASGWDSRARAAAPLQRHQRQNTATATSTVCSPTAEDGARPPSARARTARVEGDSRSHRTWSRRSRTGRAAGRLRPRSHCAGRQSADGLAQDLTTCFAWSPKRSARLDTPLRFWLSCLLALPTV
jgi:hypothetical protein